METVLYTAAMVVLWVLNLVKGTGLGQTYNVLGITKLLCVAVAVVCAMRKIRRERPLRTNRQEFFTVLLMGVVFIGSSLSHGSQTDAFDYLWTYLLVFILSETRPTRSALLLTGLAYAVMGLVVLTAYTYTDILKGWDGNSVAMVGLNSFLIFLVPYFGIRNVRSKLILIGAGIIFGILFWQTNSRSCILAAAVTLLLFFGILPTRGLLASQRMQLVMLLVPLFVAAFVAILTSAWDLAALDAWSMENFNKPIFNGRDQVWVEGFRLLGNNHWFGTGNINAGYWHNSALACLTAFGLVGYSLWTNLFRICLAHGIPYRKDPCTAGLMVAFTVIVLQQSVELGLMASNPNILPYAILGILLGRINLLREEL
ncbi:MAG: hypothetical protein IKU07_02150 [Oscillospiraceae bacterium]|nr:hypothetical protein [Oscillospiraceae bacterium]